MKKVICLILIVCLLLSGLLSFAFAENISLTAAGTGENSPAGDEWIGYTLKDLGVEFYLPAGYTVYTRGMSADDPAVKALGLTPEAIDQTLADGNYYLEATQDGFNSEVFVTMVDTSISDFSTWSDSSLLSMAASWPDQLQTYGIEMLETDIFSGGNVKYLRMHQKQTVDGVVRYRMQYYTVVNYEAVNFVYASNIDDLTESEKAFMESVVVRAVFSGAMAPAEPLPETGASAEQPSVLQEYTLSEGPFTLTLDAGRYNIVTSEMPADDPAVIRSGIKADMFETYMSLVNKSLILTDIDDKIPAAKYEIAVRIKDSKYPGVDLRECSEWLADMMLDTIYSSFSGTASDKEIISVNGVPYLKFSWMNGSQLRYATIIGGDMIYIWAARDSGRVTDEDAALLLQVVESVKYPD